MDGTPRLLLGNNDVMRMGDDRVAELRLQAIRRHERRATLQAFLRPVTHWAVTRYPSTMLAEPYRTLKAPCCELMASGDQGLFGRRQAGGVVSQVRDVVKQRTSGEQSFAQCKNRVSKVQTVGTGVTDELCRCIAFLPDTTLAEGDQPRTYQFFMAYGDRMGDPSLEQNLISERSAPPLPSDQALIRPWQSSRPFLARCCVFLQQG